MRDESFGLRVSAEFKALKMKPQQRSESSASLSSIPESQTVAQLIRQAWNILVICHIMPDGDAIGSLLGLGWALRKLGKAHTLACADPVPGSFAYLTPVVAAVSTAIAVAFWSFGLRHYQSTGT